MRAWNDFMFDWCSVAPSMFVPMSLIQLWDVEAAVEETKRCLDRGVRAVCVPEEVSVLGLPSYFSGYYDPFLALCEEAELPLCMHIQSSGWQPFRYPEAPPTLGIAISFVATQTHAVGMMYGNVCRKFPNIKIVYSEGGIGWVRCRRRAGRSHVPAPRLLGWQHRSRRPSPIRDLPAQHVVLHDR